MFAAVSDYLILFSCLLFIKKSQCSLDSGRAKISTNNGDLIIQTPENHDIKLKTQGSGKLSYNDMDLSKLIYSVQDSFDGLQECKASINSSRSKFKTIDSSINRLSEEVRNMRNNTGNNTNYSNLLMFTRRRVNIIQRRLKTISMILLTNECASSPCSNGGTCFDMYKTFFCQCPSNWEGARCETDVNECSKFLGTELGCQNGATCINKPGTYECICPDGWFGLHCTRRSTDCSSGPELCGHGTCISQTTGIGYTCICEQGWKTDGVRQACTEDVNECESYKPPCSSNPPVTCVNLPGTFYCGHCPPGYTGNGFYCTDIDECAIFNGGCSLNPLVQCINTLGSRTCGLCPPGYIGNGMSCLYQGGACSVNNGGCHPNAQCRDNSRISSTYVECLCPTGYTGNGIGPFGCTPLPTNPCFPNPCGHGECSIQGNSYVCKCNNMYSGPNCNILSNPCGSNPCLNGGTCRNLGYMFICTCPSEFDGKICDRRRDECGRIVGDSGAIEYPHQNQIHVRNCTWIIVVPEKKAVNIAFKTFSFPNCNHNWLQIVDFTQVGKYCGTKLPRGGNFTSHDHILHIYYTHAGTQPIPKFSLIWEAIDPECGGVINVTAFGTFKSPGSPGNYPNNRDCFWRFTAPMGKRIQFNFFSFMIGYNINCDGDYLEFRQGLEATDPVIAKYCNSTHPEPLFSSGHEVLVHFHSDSKLTYSGFQITYNAVEGIPGCGGIFTLEEGEISSPTVSGEYPANTLCEYKIKLPTLSKVLLTFIQLSMEYSDHCEHDYIAVYDGPSIDSPMKGKYCGKKLPSEILSISSEILIVFKSDFSQSDLGFKLKYKTVCGGKFTNPSGSIHSPNYPYYQTIKSPKRCVFEIVQPVDSIIILNITDMDFGNNTVDCDTGYIEITDVENGRQKSLGKNCKKGTQTIKSTHNYIAIRYVANFGKIKGFHLEYNVMSNNGCGGVLTNKFGTVESPPDLDSYQDGLKCIWALIAPDDYVIQLNWIKFNLEQSFSCVYDSVKVYDNATTPGSEIGTYCGTKLPPIILSSSKVLTIFFEVDNSNNQEGFLLSYTFVHEKNLCGGRYFTSSGIIKSPNYPDPYPINKDCIWVITVPSGQQLMLNFTVFDIESYLNCRYDYLEIRNGGTEASPLVGKFCGRKPPQLVTSHTNQLFLHFKSDMTKTAQGFQILWSSAATGCGGTLTSPNGMIISPHYPEPYSKNSECFWKVSVSAGSIIQVVFADLDLETNPNCVLDYVEVFDGLGITARSLGKYCTQDIELPPFLRSTTNHMTIKFRSDLSFQGRGFQLQYSTICNNEVSGFWGAIESPNYPNNLPVGHNCLWKIGVPRGNKINITFTHFELGRMIQTNSCNFDYLQIYYSKDEEEKKLKFCDSNVPTHLTIDSNSTEVQLVSDKLFIGTGFRLEWNIFGCGGILKSPEGKISTPGYPTSYPIDTTCDWQIVAEFGSSIQMTFDKVDMEQDSQCSYDFISIYNGPDDKHPMLSQFCHSIVSPVILTSSGNTMLVRFQSDSSYSGRGFEATYKTVPSKCGGTISTISGTIHSPNYPNNYDRNDSCVWLIQVHENHVVNLTVEDFDFPRVFNKSYVKIYDGPSEAYPVLALLWGNKKPNESIVSTTNHMVLEMVTHPYFTTKGFLAKFHMSCGYVLTDKSGLISLNDHILDLLDQKCSFTIKGENPEERVFLTITHMVSFCGYDNTSGIFVYDGMDSNSTLIGMYCGSSSPPTITSTGPNMHFEIYNDESNFEARYTIMDSACGGLLESIEGFITTPEFPNNYPVDTQCEWTIPVSPGNKVQIEFLDFDIAVSDNCNEDYLEIREKDNTGKLLGVFCGTNTPTNIASTIGLWLFFKSAKPVAGEQAITAKGFKAEYEMVHGMNVNGSFGQIASPLYPRSFKGMFFHDNTFKWTISVRTGYIIYINFKDFDVDYSDDFNCAMSTVNVYDGADEQAEQLGSYCGTALPPNLKTSSNVAHIVANLYLARRRVKFLIEWKRVYRGFGIPQNNSQFNSCGSDNVIDVSGTGIYNLTSPNYPGKYWNYSTCNWEFSTTDDKHLAIKFKDINIRTIYPCIIGERIKIFSISQLTNDYVQRGIVCMMNRTGNSIIEGSNKLKVVFVIQRFVRESNFTGFSAVVFEKCGGNMKDPNGIIEINNASSFYPLYKSTLDCQWNITARSGRTIKVEFLNFQVGDSDCKNYLMLKDGQYFDSPLLGTGKFCGNKNIDSLETSGNFLYVKYHGSSFLSKSAFKLRYSEVSTACGGKVILSYNDNSTIISSPNYPNVPKPHTECEWIIVAPGGESIRLDFLERFDLVISNTCATEVVEVRNGGTQYSPLIGRFCNEIPNTQFTYGNMMYIKYFTDEDLPKNGFKAQASIASCGGTLYYKGSITSPNYKNPKLYPANVDCKWALVGTKGSVIKLNFDMLDLPFSFLSNCSDIDHVTITEQNPFNNTETVIGEYCGKVAPQNIETLTNKVFVHFTTNKRQKLYNGFKLSFTEIISNCGGTLTTEFGTISPPGYPVATNLDRNCLWTIVVPKGRRIKINFDDIEFDKSYQFIQRGIAVFDGDMLSSPVTYLKSESTTRTISSSDNTLVVFFWSYYPSTNRGFRATYTSDEPTICVGDINNVNGVIKRPNGTTFKCKWERNKPLVEETIAFFIKGNFSFTRKPCITSPSFIKINVGGNFDVIIHICKTTTSPYIFRTASSNSLYLAAMLSKPPETVDFEITYKVYKCGGIHSGTGVITSPVLNDTSQDWECSWLIKPEDSDTISASFTSFDLGSSCDKHYVNIYNGLSIKSPKIGQYCSASPGSIKSTSGLLIEYHREKGSDGKGFKLRIETVANGCGGVIHSETTLIQTPSYPKNYPDNAECLWEIVAPAGYHISVNFIDRFQIENSDKCKNDFVMLYSEKEDESKEELRQCGRDPQTRSFNSTSNHLFILFRSNSRVGGAGFKLQWKLICGGTFIATNTKKYIVSPGYPNGYENNMLCTYKIIARMSSVRLEFEDFELEDSMGCLDDSVSINRRMRFVYRGGSRYCGTRKIPVITERSSIEFTFRTDQWITKKGFKVSYVTDECGGNITTPSVISYNEGSGSLLYKVCIWSIIPPKDQRVTIRFLKVNVPMSWSCTSRNIEVSDQSGVLANMCGNLTDTQLPVIHSNNGSATIKYRSMYSKASFDAAVYFTPGPAAGCGGDIKVKNMSEYLINSEHATSYDCIWKFTTDNDYTFKIDFQDSSKCNSTNAVSSPTLGNCSCGLYEIRDGITSNSEIIANFCDFTSNTSTSYYTSGRYTFIRIVNVASVGHKPKITVKSIESLCGPTILEATPTAKYLTTPNYPNPYPEGLKCLWRIKTYSFFTRINIKFIDFDINTDAKSNVSCNGLDKLEIKRSMAGTSQALSDTIYPPKNIPIYYKSYTFCSKEDTGLSIRSKASIASLIFTSNFGKKHGKGIKIEYKISSCIQNFTGLYGTVEVNGHANNENCSIYITTPKNYTINLYFNGHYYFNINCNKSLVVIKEGDRYEKELFKSCENNVPQTLFSSSNKVHISLLGAGKSTYFTMLYTASWKDRGCGGEFYGLEGTITSPLYPQSYTKDIKCEWTIKAPQGRKISLIFPSFDLQGTCEETNLMIEMGSGSVVFCPTTFPADQMADNNVVKLTYKSHPNNAGMGWKAKFTTYTDEDSVLTRFNRFMMP